MGPSLGEGGRERGGGLADWANTPVPSVGCCSASDAGAARISAAAWLVFGVVSISSEGVNFPGHASGLVLHVVLLTSPLTWLADAP